MNSRPFRAALLATAAALIWFQTASPGLARPANPPRGPAAQAPSSTGSMTEIRALFADYLKLHAAKKMDEWQSRMFLPEAICVRTSGDGKVTVFPVAELAQAISDEAKNFEEQHETLEDARIEIYGNAAHYAASWTLFQNNKQAAKGRAFFSLVRKEGAWKIAALVWYTE